MARRRSSDRFLICRSQVRFLSGSTTKSSLLNVRWPRAAYLQTLLRCQRDLLGSHLIDLHLREGNSPTRATQVDGTWTRVGPFAGGLENGGSARNAQLIGTSAIAQLRLKSPVFRGFCPCRLAEKRPPTCTVRRAESCEASPRDFGPLDLRLGSIIQTDENV